MREPGRGRIRTSTYGREHETQADDLGFGYALSSGYDTRQMISVFEMLRRNAELGGVGRLPEWQSSHPDPVSAYARSALPAPVRFARGVAAR